MKKETCLWTQDDDGIWGTSCGDMFVLVDGTPSQNRKFCPMCGKTLRVVSPEITIHADPEPEESTKGPR